MWKTIMLCIVFVAGAAGTAFAQNQDHVHLEFEGIYWFPEMRADARISGQTQRGTDFNLDRDIGLGNKDIPGGRFIWYTGPKSRLFLEFTQYDTHREAALNRQIVIKDVTYDAGANASTDLKIRFAKLGWIWQFINKSNGAFKLGTILEARTAFIDFSVAGQTQTSGITKESKNFFIGLPTLGIAIDFNPADWANIFFRTSGMYFGKYGYFGYGEAGVKLIAARNLSFSFGYRHEALEAREDDNNSRIRQTLKGPFIAASLRF